MADVILNDPDDKDRTSGIPSNPDSNKEQNGSKDAQKLSDDKDNNDGSGESVSARLKDIKKSNVNIAGGDIKIDKSKIDKKYLSSIGVDGDVNNANMIIGDNNVIVLANDKFKLAREYKVPKNLEEAFNQLELEQRVFFLTMCFFEGLKVSEFNQVYANILRSLAENLFNEDEKREIGRSFLKPVPNFIGLEVCQEYDPEKLAKVYKFKRNDTAQKLFAFVIKEYAALLFDYVIALRILIEEQRSVDVRRFAAFALGELTKEDFEHVIRNAITPLCTSHKDTARVSVAYYFAYLFNGEGANQDIKDRLHDLLEDWIKQSGWLWKWTVAAICERLGLLEKPDLENFSQELLDKLARTDNVRVANAVIHALVGWSLNGKLEFTIGNIKTWVEEGIAGIGNTLDEYEVRCVVGLWAFWRIIWVHQSLIKTPPPNLTLKPIDIFSMLNQNDKINPILVSVGIRSFECGLGNDFLDNLASLVDLDNKDEIQLLVIDWIREVYQSLSPRTTFRPSIKGMINNYWAKSKNPNLKNIAQKLQDL
mgnify:CR=1 FL=1